MALADLDALIDATTQNTSQFNGLTAAYVFLGFGVPTIAGYTTLINDNNTSNFGAGASGPTFNDENIYINTMNALYQGNPTAKANFDAIVNSGATMQDKLSAVYNSVIPTANQSDAGRAYFISQADFYSARAAELGIAGLNGAALVGAAALIKIAVDNDIPGIGDSINDLYAAVEDGTAAIPEDGAAFTPIETADGATYDGDDASVSAGLNTTLDVNQNVISGKAENDDVVNGVTTGAIATSTLQVSDVISLGTGTGTDTVNITDVTGGASALGAGTLPMLNGADIVNVTNVGGGALTVDTTFAPDAKNLNQVNPGVAADGLVWINAQLGAQEFGAKGNAVGAALTVNLAGGDTGSSDAVTINLMGNANAAGAAGVGAVTINGSTTAASNGGAETVNLTSTGSANVVAGLASNDSAAANVLKNVNVTGDQSTTINGSTLVSGGKFDASGLSGNLTTFINHQTAGTALTVNGGTGMNIIGLDAITSKDTVDAGAGTTDVVGITGNTAVAAGGMAGVTNAETFALFGASTASQDVDNIGAFNSYLIASTGAGASFTDLGNNANVRISANTAGNTVVELKTDGVADVVNLSLNDGSAGTAQTINQLSVDANGAGVVETVNIDVGSTGGVTITTNNITGRDINVTGGDNFNIGALEASTLSFNASAATGNITVAAAAAGAQVIGIQTGAGNDNVTLQGAAGGDVKADVGAGNDTVTVATAQEHSVTLGAGTDTVDFNDLATKIATGGAISTATEFLTVSDFVAADDTIKLDPGQFAGLTAGALASGQYIEGTLASTAALDSQVELIAQNGGIGAAQQYIAAIQIGSDVHIFYDADGHGTAGNVSEIAVLSNVDLTGISAADFTVA